MPRLPVDLNCIPVIVDNSTGERFVPLPSQLWRSTYEPCGCEVCKGVTGYLDTMMVPGIGETIMVHMPELQALRPTRHEQKDFHSPKVFVDHGNSDEGFHITGD